MGGGIACEVEVRYSVIQQVCMCHREFRNVHPSKLIIHPNVAAFGAL